MDDTQRQYATFGAGCFWGVEAAYRQIPGVLETSVGYMGGERADNPTYEQVCSGATGHAEVVHLTYDPTRVSYEEPLDVFWANHDPTQRNRQGWDIGTQYRSVVFTYDDNQHVAAEAAITELGKRRFRRPVVTQVVPAMDYWPAEHYHQQYLEKRGMSTCRI